MERAISPVCQLTGPGTPIPTPRSVSAGRPDRFSMASSSPGYRVKNLARPFSIALSMTVSLITSPSAVLTASRP